MPRVPWGSVELEREGNRIRASTKGVERFRLLISPDVFDVSRPITVEVDGRVLFDEPIRPSLACLLRWAAVDDDRSRLFVAEIPIQL